MAEENKSTEQKAEQPKIRVAIPTRLDGPEMLEKNPEIKDNPFSNTRGIGQIIWNNLPERGTLDEMLESVRSKGHVNPRQARRYVRDLMGMGAVRVVVVKSS